MGALLWALNPQKVESAIWVSERKDVLCGLLAFLAFWGVPGAPAWLVCPFDGNGDLGKARSHSVARHLCGLRLGRGRKALASWHSRARPGRCGGDGLFVVGH